MRGDALLPLWEAGFKSGECREALETGEGYKTSRLLISAFKAEVLHDWAKSQNIFFRKGTLDVYESGLRENKGSWINTGYLGKFRGSWVYCYIGRTEADVVAALDADMSDEEQPAELARLFRIPSCCLDAYLARRAAKLDLMGDPGRYIVGRCSTSQPYLNNYLVQYFDGGYIHYFPCAWDCRASSSRSADVRSLVHNTSKLWGERLDRLGRSSVVLSDDGSVHALIGATMKDMIDIRPSDVLSTTHPQWIHDIRREGRVSRDQLSIYGTVITFV
jgi:hypothetical protein